MKVTEAFALQSRRTLSTAFPTPHRQTMSYVRNREADEVAQEVCYFIFSCIKYVIETVAKICTLALYFIMGVILSSSAVMCLKQSMHAICSNPISRMLSRVPASHCQMVESLGYVELAVFIFFALASLTIVGSCLERIAEAIELALKEK